MSTKAGPETGRKIEMEVELDATPEQVWKALTDGEELKRWFPLEARVTPGVGGAIFLSWGADCEGQAGISVWEPGKRFGWTEKSPFTPEGAEPQILTLDWIIEKRGGKTVLRLVHSGFGAAAASDWENEYFDSLNYGWTFMLTNLRHYFAHHAGTPRQVAWLRRKVSIAREEAFRRLAAPDGLFTGGPLAALKPGANYSLPTAVGDAYTGRVEFYVPPRGFCVSVAQLNHALLWLTIEGAPGQHEVQLWLSAYSLPAAQLGEFEQKWRAVLERLLPETPPSAPPQ